MYRISGSYKVTVTCNTPTTGWRAKLGRWLRSIADLMDGKQSLAIELWSDPPLRCDVHESCVRTGVDAMAKAFKAEVEDAKREELFRLARPELFEEAAGATGRGASASR